MEDSPVPSSPELEAPKASPPSVHRIVLFNREPESHSKLLTSAPAGCRELPVLTAHRRSISDRSKTLVFKLTYNERAATIFVTVNEKGQLVNAFVGGALAGVVSPQVLLREKSNGFFSDNRQRDHMDGGELPNALGQNLIEVKCAASAVAKTILETLGFCW